MRKIRWGLIGCGDISRKRVAPALRDLDCCDFQAVARADSDRAASFAREFGAAKWFGSWRELIGDRDIDAVYIATPVSLHSEQTIASAMAGKHVLCEKPMGLNVKECDSMIQACDNHHVSLGLAYYRHFYPLVKRVKEIMAAKEIGEPCMADIQAFEWFDRKPGDPRAWLLEKEKSGGGPMMDFGCHRIEVLQNLFGPVRDIQAGLFNLALKERDVEDTAVVSLLFESSVQASLRVTHASFESRDTLDIFGTKGSLHIPVLNGDTLIIKTNGGERIEKIPPHENVHLPLIEDFTHALLEKRKPLVDGLIGREVSLVLDRIYGRPEIDKT